MNEKVMMKGNEAIAEAAILAGCRHYFGYPITPQTEVAAYMAKKMPKIGGTFLQAESEIAAINMVYGVASTGKPAMTSSSSPGISLKCEGISYLAGADLPALIVNVQRGGPGLGGIQPSQSDYFLATRGPGHGDFHVFVFAPASVQEMADLTGRALHVAWKYRMPSMLLADGTMGQMMEPVVLPEAADAFGSDNPWAAVGTGMKRPHNVIISLYLAPEELERINFERFKRYELAEAEETLWEEYMMEDAEICVVSYGITARVSRNAIVEHAISQAKIEGADAKLFQGPTAIAVGGDIAAVAKALVDFQKKNAALKLRACYSEGVWYNEAQVKQLSTIGTKEENLSKLAGALYNAVAQSAQVLQAPIRDFAYVIKALEDKQK